jgi:hypothetical protein
VELDSYRQRDAFVPVTTNYCRRKARWELGELPSCPRSFKFFRSVEWEQGLSASCMKNAHASPATRRAANESTCAGQMLRWWLFLSANELGRSSSCPELCSSPRSSLQVDRKYLEMVSLSAARSSGLSSGISTLRREDCST